MFFFLFSSSAGLLPALPGILKTFQVHACSGSQLTLKCPENTTIAITLATYGLVPLALPSSTATSDTLSLLSTASSSSLSSASVHANTVAANNSNQLSDSSVFLDNALCLPSSTSASNSDGHRSPQVTSDQSISSSSPSSNIIGSPSINVKRDQYDTCSAATESFRVSFSISTLAFSLFLLLSSFPVHHANTLARLFTFIFSVSRRE